MNLGRVVCYALLAGALSACASKAPSYYTLLPATVQSDAGKVSGLASSKYAISVQAVQLPEQVDRLQIVLTDPASTQVTPLGSSLWAAPLSDEIRNALANDLSRKLGVLDVANGVVPESLPLWKIALRVQRFESIYDQRVVLGASWRLAPLNQPGKQPRLCSAVVQVAVGAGMSALVAGHQQALQAVALMIAGQLSDGQGAGEQGLDSRVAVQNKGCLS